MSRPRVAGLVRVAGLALLWGSGFLWIKIALRGLSPVQVTLLRLVLGAAVLLVVVYAQRRRMPRGGRLWAHLTVAALFANAVPYLLFALAERTVDSAAAGMINSSTPLWTMLLAYLVGQDRTRTVTRIGGLLVGFAGTLLIFSPWSTGTQVMTWGGLACLVASICYAISYVYMDRHLTGRGLPPIVLSTGQLLAASGLLLLATPFGGLEPVALRADAVAAITVLGVLGTGVAYVLNYRIIQDDGSVLASTVTYLLPPVAVLLGWAVLGEVPTALALLGTLLTLAGTLIARIRRP